MDDIEIANQNFKMLNFVPLGLCVLRKDLTVLFWNHLLECWTGIYKSEIEGKLITEYFLHLKEDKYQKRFSEVFTNGVMIILSSLLHKYIIPAQLPNGEMRLQQTILSPVKISDREECWLLMSIQDVTDHMYRINQYKTAHNLAMSEIEERKCAEQALRESEEKYRALIEFADDCIYALDKKGYFISVNQATARLISKTPEEIIGKEFYALFSREKANIYLKRMKQVFKDKKPVFNIIGQITTSQGAIYLNTTFSPIKDNNDNVMFILAISRNITAQKQMEKELQQAKEKAEEANRIKTEFLANMSHELRSPLHGILSFTNFGIEEIEEENKEKLLEYLKKIKQLGDRLLALLNNLLDLSKLEAGKMPYSFKKISITHLILHLTSGLDVIFKEKGVTIQFDKPDFNDTVEIDEHKILQVIQNVLSNASKFSSKESIVRIELHDKEKDILLSVINRGVGIPENELETIFDKFAQSSKTKTGAGGTGLGLSICREIIQDHNGKIWAEKNPEGGAVVRILIPKEQKERKKIGKILVENGIINKEQLQQAVEKQKLLNTDEPHGSGI